jgi:hypothetical protein
MLSDAAIVATFVLRVLSNNKSLTTKGTKVHEVNS